MARFDISGGRPIGGAVRPAGNKNAALAMLAASTLTPEPVVIEGVPDIGDVRTMCAILTELGADVSWKGDTLEVDTADLTPKAVDQRLASRIRASLLLAGPLVARFGTAQIGAPGGDVIGERRNDPHWNALAALGIAVADSDAGGYRLESPGRLRGADIWLDETSVMATENVVMAASLADGVTVLRNAASEPHVQDLCRMLVGMGASIEGIGTNLLRVTGAPALSTGRGVCGPDYMEIGSFVCLAAITGGELRLGPVRPDELTHVLTSLARIGIRVDVAGADLVVPGGQRLRIVPDRGGAIPRLREGPWPGFPADLMPIALVSATQAEGTLLLHQWMFESRLFFVDRLIEMGARIILADPHRAVVAGPAQLRGGALQGPDIRAGMALIMAALCAEGRSVIGNVGQIDRGYERIDQRLRDLGADIERLED